jgi:hypothetical protein
MTSFGLPFFVILGQKSWAQMRFREGLCDGMRLLTDDLTLRTNWRLRISLKNFRVGEWESESILTTP